MFTLIVSLLREKENVFTQQIKQEKSSSFLKVAEFDQTRGGNVEKWWKRGGFG